MMNLLAALAALTAMPQTADSFSERLEHQGAAYDIVYQPRISTIERTVTTRTARGQTLQWCRATTLIAVDGEVRLTDGTAAATHRLPGERRFSQQYVGSCERNRSVIAAAAQRNAPAVRTHVRDLAAAGRPVLLARVEAGRAFAVN